MPVYDTQCGAKMFRVNDRTRPLFSRPFISRWVFDVELLARYIGIRKAQGAHEVRAGICEIPLQIWHDVAGSKVRPRDFFRAFVDVAKIAATYRSALRE